MPVRPGVPPPGVGLPPGPRPGGVLGQGPGMPQGMTLFFIMIEMFKNILKSSYTF